MPEVKLIKRNLKQRKKIYYNTVSTNYGSDSCVNDPTFTPKQSASPAGGFDTKTSSWLKTPAEIRKLGGALFGDRRYGQVFVYHNSAESYYSARGFRGLLRV